MKKPHADVMRYTNITQFALGFVQRPICRHEADVFVAVRIPNHDFLDVTTPFDMCTIDGIVPTRFDDLLTIGEIVACLEERNDVDTTVWQR